jgi:hypothetical protein
MPQLGITPGQAQAVTTGAGGLDRLLSAGPPVLETPASMPAPVPQRPPERRQRPIRPRQQPQPEPAGPLTVDAAYLRALFDAVHVKAWGQGKQVYPTKYTFYANDEVKALIGKLDEAMPELNRSEVLIAGLRLLDEAMRRAGLAGDAAASAEVTAQQSHSPAS